MFLYSSYIYGGIYLSIACIVHLSLSLYIYVYIYICIHIHIYIVCVCVHICIHTQVDTYTVALSSLDHPETLVDQMTRIFKYLSRGSAAAGITMHACAYHMRACLHHACMHTCMHSHIHTHIHTHMRTHMHAYKHRHVRHLGPEPAAPLFRA